jgi:hypothetical protein
MPAVGGEQIASESKILMSNPYKATVEERAQWKVTVGRRGKKFKRTPLVSLGQPAMKQRKVSYTHGEVAAEL